MTNSGPLEDRLLIRELYGLYGDASCRGDREGACEGLHGRKISINVYRRKATLLAGFARRVDIRV